MPPQPYIYQFQNTVGYNPGMDALARGIMAGAHGLADGLRARAEKQEQDKAFQGKSKALESYLKTHADSFGGQADEFTAQDPDETPRQRYERLQGLVENQFLEQRAAREKQAQQIQTQQLALMQQQQQAQALQQQQATEAQARDQQTVDTFRALSAPEGAGMDVLQHYPAGVDPAQVDALLKRPGVQELAAASQAGIPITAAQVNEVLGRGPAWQPQVMDLGGGRQAMTTSPRSAVPLEAPKPEKPIAENQLWDAYQAAQQAGDTERATYLKDIIEKKRKMPEGGLAELLGGLGGGAPAASGPKKITSKAEFDALPSGTEYVGPDGKRARKP